MPSNTIKFSFPDVELSEADEQCADLYDTLVLEIPDAEVARHRTDDLTQDFGASLLIVLSTPGFVVLIRELSKWLTRRYDTRLHIRRTDGKGKQREITISGPIDTRAQQILESFFSD